MDEQQEQDPYQDYLDWQAAEDEYWDRVGREEAERLERHKREEWQQAHDQWLDSLPFERAIDQWMADRQQRADACRGLDEWPGL